MKYPDRGNRVFRIENGAESPAWLIAPDAEAAVATYRELVNFDPDHALAVEEVAPERQIRVTFDDACEAIGAAAGLSPVARSAIRRLLREEKKLIDGTITIARAAEQWARTIPTGRVEVLGTAAF